MKEEDAELMVPLERAKSILSQTVHLIKCGGDAENEEYYGRVELLEEAVEAVRVDGGEE